MLARLIGLVGLSLVVAAPLAAQQVPPPLRDWQDWVLHDVPEHACPTLATDTAHACVWPGKLAIDAGEHGGTFAFTVRLDAPDWVALPGDARHWPQGVTVDGKPAVVLDHDSTPAVRLAPGDHPLRGTLPWATRPARLRVPAAFGLVALSVDGKAVAQLERHGDELTLGEATAAQRTADALSLRVYRRLADGVPATLTTRLQFTVAGSAREAVFGPVLPTGFVATALEGDLPAQWQGDGGLRVQLRPGTWTLTLDARATSAVAKIVPRQLAAPWPRQEIWSYADDPVLRTSRAEGQAVDAAQAGVPPVWRNLPAFALGAGNGLTVVDGARGEQGGKGDQLHLKRQLWLDFDGAGFSASDQLTGTLRQRQRLDVAAPWQLERASERGTPLLVTQGENGRRGVELRGESIDLHAGLRLPASAGALPVSGWQVPLDGIDATLHLPHGYRLIAAPGVDRAPTTWVARWTLLDLFVLALAALLAGRLLGWRWGAVAAGYLLLGQHEAGAPLWILVAVLLLALLLRALPAGRLRGVVHGGAVAVLALAVLWSLPFAAGELQVALHPQLEHSTSGAPVQVQFVEPDAAQAPTAKRMAAMEAAQAPAAPAPSAGFALRQPHVVMMAPPPGIAPARGPVEIGGVVQAGGGMPAWNQGNDYPLGWSGPVTATQAMHLVVAPRWLVRLLRVALIVLLAALLAKLALTLRPWSLRLPAWHSQAAAGLLLLAVAGMPLAAHAQSLPDQALLDQLKARLLEAPKCAPDCAQVAQANFAVNGDALDLALEIHAGADVAVPLPQPGAGLQLAGARLDGQATAVVAPDGNALVRVDRGVHRVDLHYQLTGGDSASLQFALPPQRVAFSGPGWTLDGVDGDRLLGDSVTLQRTPAAGSAATAPAQAFPPYVRVARILRLGVDWQVENRVTRIAPAHGGFSVSVPLLPGEHPLGANAVVKDGRIDVTFNADATTVRWESRLDHAATLALTAPPLGERAEVWRVEATPLWHVEASGVPPSADGAGLRFQPLPGETLHLALRQPAAVAGGSLAFDRVAAQTRIGERASETTLDLAARSTRGGEHAITLPAGVELVDARRDGAPLNLVIRDGKLGLPVLPGTHDYQLRLREPGGIAARIRGVALALGAPVANIGTGLDLPHDRWVLWTWGPTTGPAVLYWSQLVVLPGVAWLLARYAPTPLRRRHWVLLGLGFSAFAWSAFALVAAWLVLFGLRARAANPQAWRRWLFNLAQVGLAALTVLAVATLVVAVPKGLLGVPDMHVAGNDSTATALRWFADRSAGTLPATGVVSVSLWWYKLAMLAWALWLAFALVDWLRWIFAAWSHGGYWRRAVPPPLPPSASEAPRD